VVMDEGVVLTGGEEQAGCDVALVPLPRDLLIDSLGERQVPSRGSHAREARIGGGDAATEKLLTVLRALTVPSANAPTQG